MRHSTDLSAMFYRLFEIEREKERKKGENNLCRIYQTSDKSVAIDLLSLFFFFFLDRNTIPSEIAGLIIKKV